MAWRVGVDIGGTFTDVALVEEENGRIEVFKVPTTPRDFGEGVVAGLRAGLRQAALDPAAVALLSHATTIVTNALLEGKGAKAGFVATRGFRDILELRRSSRADLYDLLQDAPAVLVPRRWRFEVTERIGAQGEVVTPLEEADIDRLVAAVREAGLETVAVSLLFSFLNDAHERHLGERLRAALPGVGVYLSCEVLPEIREFERASTTAVCAAIGPLLAGYLDGLQQRVSALGLPRLHVMGSSGGMIEVGEALRMPAMAIESGPAAGVVAAALAGKALGLSSLISFDMGGTTAKASLVAGGEIAVTAEYEVGGGGHGKRAMNGTGHPIRVPVIDLAEVSAGGGSIAWVDAGGALRVGPASAGADPGPAAYGKGGRDPTVSDADLVLGYLDEAALLGGALKLDRAAAEAALARAVAGPLGLGTVEAAAKIVEIVDNNMAQALRIVSVERGHDPREFSLVAFGGAGPLHAAALARLLEIPEVVVPPAPGAFSALGLVAGDLKRDYSKTLYTALDEIGPERLAAAYAGLEESARAMLEAAAIPPARRALERAADLRYGRQAYELTVPCPDGPIEAATIAALARRFHERHRRTYGHANEEERVQLVNIRLRAIGRLPPVALRRPPDPAGARERRRDAWFAETGFIRTAVLWRDGLSARSRIEGPAIVESADSTVLIPPGWVAAVDAAGYIRMRR
ncbi:MAG TPA: hydantoinase/oxoprolinase family protein [Stellaceae bacterium]|nr:hydantoinase/oxoprolinase family protein [Stellaceae bacterium]